jgi:hypothetical protein
MSNSAVWLSVITACLHMITHDATHEPHDMAHATHDTDTRDMCNRHMTDGLYAGRRWVIDSSQAHAFLFIE